MKLLKKWLLGLGAIGATVAAPIAVVSAAGHQEQTKREADPLAGKIVTQWSEKWLSHKTPETAYVETLAHFLDRKSGEVGFIRSEKWANAYMYDYSRYKDPSIHYYIGQGGEAWLRYQFEWPIQQKADKGQLIIDMVTLISSINTFVENKIYSIQWQINDNQWKFTDEVFGITQGWTTKTMTQDEITRGTAAAALHRNLISHTYQPLLTTWKTYLKNLRRYWTDLTTLINGGLVDILPFERDTMVVVLEEMKSSEADEYNKLHQIIGIEEVVEPQIFTTKMEEIAHMVERNTVVHVPVSEETPITQTVAGHTLASEMPVNAGGTQGGH